MNTCEICPRGCAVNRQKTAGFCGEKSEIRIAKIIEHFCWEEPCLADEKGTLAIFFSGCNLRCSYCQNFQISRGGVGTVFSVDELCRLIEEKQDSHSSIDLITPTHFAEQLCQVFAQVKPKIPVIWNTSGYEATQTIEKVSTFVDIFLTDLKYATDALGQKFSTCKNYHTAAIAAIKKMCALKSDVIDGPLMKQGVIIRHLVLPNEIQNSIGVLDDIKAHFPNRIVSIMSQFTPNGHGEPSRKLTKIEYKAVLAHLEKLGLENGFLQDFSSANPNFVPEF